MTDNSTTARCPICDGTGVTGITVADYYSGGPQQLTTCYSCGGSGELPERLAKLRAWHLTAPSHVADEVDFDESDKLNYGLEGRPYDIVDIVRQRLADGRPVADHDVLRL